MPWPVHPNGLLGAQGDNDSYRVERSLRFNSADLAYLNRTLTTPTSQSIFTLSLWVKLGLLGTTRQIFGVSTNHSFGFTTTNALNLTFAATSALTTTALFRDPSAWYHIVWSQNGTSHTLYVNGVSVGTATATSNTFNTAVAHQLGAANTSSYFNGYITEANFIDGQALTPSSFGETDAITGRWKVKAYSGTYGTNGFYLKFADNSGTTAATLGKDSSGNGNNWTPNAFSVTAGIGNDSLVDSPTNYGFDSYKTTLDNSRGNYNTFNPLRGSTLANGNLDVGPSASGIGSIGMTSGKWYWEATSTGGATAVGLYDISPVVTQSIPDGLTYGFRLDVDAGTLDYTTDGSTFTTKATGLQASIFVSAWFIFASTAAATTASLNCGQRLFLYNMPSGYKTLCATNLPTPKIKKPRSYFDSIAYTGTSVSNSISSFGFPPDLVWIKNRATTTSHALYDTTRLATKQLSSDTTGDEATSSTGLTSFDTSGFTLGTSTLVNTIGTQYVAWAWNRQTIAGIDIVNYTGNGANRTISHNLGVAPKMIVVKARTTAGADQGWAVWHNLIGISTGDNKYLQLNSTAAIATGSDYWNSTSPTSSVFSVGTNVAVNASADTYIAYIFADVDGFSKIGSYTGNAAADGTFVHCGFLPSFVLIKSSTAIDSWLIYDNKRNTFNVASTNLVPNTAAADATISGIDFVSNGFKLRTITTTPNAAQTYIFAAFAESPFKYARAR